jgi:hypothetical protein
MKRIISSLVLTVCAAAVFAQGEVYLRGLRGGFNSNRSTIELKDKSLGHDNIIEEQVKYRTFYPSVLDQVIINTDNAVSYLTWTAGGILVDMAGLVLPGKATHSVSPSDENTIISTSMKGADVEMFGFQVGRHFRQRKNHKAFFFGLDFMIYGTGLTQGAGDTNLQNTGLLGLLGQGGPALFLYRVTHPKDRWLFKYGIVHGAHFNNGQKSIGTRTSLEFEANYLIGDFMSAFAGWKYTARTNNEDLGINEPIDYNANFTGIKFGVTYQILGNLIGGN